jgi:hypothetical protein
MIHLCGPASAKAFVHRGFHLIAGERCGEHDVATYPVLCSNGHCKKVAVALPKNHMNGGYCVD